MIKKLNILLVLVMTVFFTINTAVNLNANNEKTIKIENETVNVLVDPVNYTNDGITLIDTSNKHVLYTPSFPYEKTNRNEASTNYVFNYENNNYKITEIVETNTLIPLNGLVLSVLESSSLSFKVGDTLNLEGLTVERFNYAIKSNKGVRIGFNDVNESRKANRFTYYNSERGTNTGTNTYGSEMVVDFDSTLNSFKVKSLGKGGDSLIPQTGFVISTSGIPYEQMLLEGVLFNKDDKIELVNLNFVKTEEVFTHKFTSINGTRLENYLVIYPASSNPTLKSGQNVHGYEVAVDKHGFVIEMGTLVDIPEGGFVLSGHGTNNTFLIKNIKFGAKITYDEQTKLITVKNLLVEQTLMTVEKDREEALELIEHAKENMLDVLLEEALTKFDVADEYYDELLSLKETIDQGSNPTEIMPSLVRFKELSEILLPLFPEIYFDTLVSGKIESRGVWHRPNEMNLADIEETLDDLKAMNFTDVYVETFWNGYLVYPSDIAPYQTKIGNNFGKYGNDYLKAFIEEAKKRDILVHAWVENFFVGVSTHYSSLWDDHEDWRIKNYNGSEIQTGKPGGEEEGFKFFDPANPEVQNFVLSIYEELVTNYELAGLQLDYIRYPSVNTELKHTSGYTEYAMNEFKELNNLTGDVKELVNDEAILRKWNQYRQNVINKFVNKIHEDIREINRELVLSIAVGPDADYAPKNLMQDWRTWINNGWIDLVMPMVYVSDVNQVISTVLKSMEISKDLSFNYTGISPTYDSLPAIYNAYYTKASIESGANGTAIFASHNLKGNNEVINILKSGTYRNKAVSPHDSVNNILDFFIEDILYKSKNIYVKNEQMTNEQATLLEKKLNSYKEREYNNPVDFDHLYNELDNLFLTLELYVKNGVAKDRIVEDINKFMNILNIKINRYLTNYGHWDMTVNKERPNIYEIEYPVIEKDNKDENNNNKTLIIVGSIIGGLSIIGVTSFVIYKKRK